MQRGFKIIGIVVIAVLLVLLSLYLVMWDMRRRSYSSQFEYRLDIHPDSDISNVEVYAPLPEDLSGEDITAPDGWNVEFYAEIILNGRDHENMIKVEAEEITAHSYESLFISMDKDEDIDTIDPWDKEPMIEPKDNLNEIDCDYPGASERVRCYRYSASIYARFEAEEDTKTDISVEIYGSNTWWVGGWSGNEYYDRSWAQIVGGSEGIHEATGEVRTGMGNY